MDAEKIVWRDSDPGVADSHDGVAIITLGNDFDPPAFGRVLERVRQQVPDDLLQSRRISLHDDPVADAMEVQRKSVGLG